MTIATSLRNAARNLITTFGNDASLYSYSGATKTTNDEGDVTVTNWGTASTVKVIDGENIVQQLSFVNQGVESLGSDQKTIRDDVTIALNDRISIDSIDYRVTEINKVKIQSTVIIQVVRISKVTSTSSW